jgi:hypothetical protein
MKEQIVLIFVKWLLKMFAPNYYLSNKGNRGKREAEK